MKLTEIYKLREAKKLTPPHGGVGTYVMFTTSDGEYENFYIKKASAKLLKQQLQKNPEGYPNTTAGAMSFFASYKPLKLSDQPVDALKIYVDKPVYVYNAGDEKVQKWMQGLEWGDDEVGWVKRDSPAQQDADWEDDVGRAERDDKFRDYD